MQSPLAPIRARNLADTIYDRLLESIISGEHAVGQRIHLDNLAVTFGVSRSPIREALTRLSHAGLVNVSRNAATTVAHWDAHDMRFRGRVLGGIARATIRDRSVHASVRMPEITDHPIDFVRICAALIEASTNSLGEQLIEEVGAPLELFLRSDVLRAHHIPAARPWNSDRARRLHTALDDQDAAATVRLLDELTEAFVLSLQGA